DRMLKVNVVAVGRHKDKWLAGGVEHYSKLLSRYAKLNIEIVTIGKAQSALPPSELMKAEAVAISKHIKKGSTIALTDRGRRFDSLAFAKHIEKLQIQSGGQVNFIIGGAHGLDKSITLEALDLLSFSDFTFSHQLVRLLLLEQLYRAFSILHNTDYHK
ncbi:MAG: 23S rRNA (pseudouridine(1915)-N(3))-methyltransferase RlmH, partial [candidate division Zixibacteria bacterium]